MNGSSAGRFLGMHAPRVAAECALEQGLSDFLSGRPDPASLPPRNSVSGLVVPDVILAETEGLRGVEDEHFLADILGDGVAGEA